MIFERNIRKNNCKLFECFFKSKDMASFNHYYLKGLMYNEIKPKSINDCLIKQLYDGYNYLLINSVNNLEERIINRFFYLLDGIVLDTNIILKLQTKYLLCEESPIEKSIELMIDIINIVDEYDFSYFFKNIKNLIGVVFLNYSLVHYNLFSINPFVNKEMTKQFDDLIEQYNKGNKVSLTELILKLEIDQKTKKNKQEKRYYLNIKKLTFTDIYNRLNEIKESLKNNYSVNHIYVYGSFCDSNNRFDSDIDLLCDFNRDITYDEKNKIKEKLENYLFGIFDRFIDIHMMSNYITSQMIVSLENIKKIY